MFLQNDANSFCWLVALGGDRYATRQYYLLNMLTSDMPLLNPLQNLSNAISEEVNYTQTKEMTRYIF